jgi:deoxyribose-phosphate aldolase
MIAAGATRLGMSQTRRVVDELRERGQQHVADDG